MAERSQLQDLVGGAFSLADLLDVEPGTVASRTLVDAAGVTVTLLAIDETEGLDEHSAPHDVLLQALDGTATVTVGGEPHEVRGGQAIVLPADVPHAVDAVTPVTLLLTVLRSA